MIHEQIKLSVDGSLEYASLYTYIQDYSEEIGIKKRPMIILCPGGGYEYTSDREAEPLAIAFLGMGVNVAVLRYSVAPAQFPTALKELALAVKTVRENAEKWHVDADKILVEGASAGGHLAASLGCFWNKPFMSDIGKPEEIKPNGMILCYPVITAGEYTHEGSVIALSGKLTDASEFGENDLIQFFSLENQVTPDTPPTFIWSTFEDGCVPVQNTLMFADALRKNNVSTELHVFAHGGHGLALANVLTNSPTGFEEQKEVAEWIGLAKKWLWANYPITTVY